MPDTIPLPLSVLKAGLNAVLVDNEIDFNVTYHSSDYPDRPHTVIGRLSMDPAQIETLVVEGLSDWMIVSMNAARAPNFLDELSDFLNAQIEAAPDYGAFLPDIQHAPCPFCLIGETPVPGKLLFASGTTDETTGEFSTNSVLIEFSPKSVLIEFGDAEVNARVGFNVPDWIDADWQAKDAAQAAAVFNVPNDFRDLIEETLSMDIETSEGISVRGAGPNGASLTVLPPIDFVNLMADPWVALLRALGGCSGPNVASFDGARAAGTITGQKSPLAITDGNRSPQFELKV